MKDKSKVLLIAIILVVTAAIAYVGYGIVKGKKNPVVTMQVSYKDAEGNDKVGTVKVELYPDAAPETVANFIALANNGYYDGLTFHRIVKNFVVQGGDKKGDGSGSAKLSDINKSIEAGSSNDYTYSIKGEYSNGLKDGTAIIREMLPKKDNLYIKGKYKEGERNGYFSIVDKENGINTNHQYISFIQTRLIKEYNKKYNENINGKEVSISITCRNNPINQLKDLISIRFTNLLTLDLTRANIDSIAFLKFTAKSNHSG